MKRIQNSGMKFNTKACFEFRAGRARQADSCTIRNTLEVLTGLHKKNKENIYKQIIVKLRKTGIIASCKWQCCSWNFVILLNI